MSRYTDLMQKKTEELTPKEKIELAKLILEEFDREERRINKLPIDQQTKQECLWNVINAHQDMMDYILSEDFGLEINQEQARWRGRMTTANEHLRKHKEARQQDQTIDSIKYGDISDDKIQNVKDKYSRLLDNKDDAKITLKSVRKASGNLSMGKSDDNYSLAGDTTITDEQRKALYQFHHWMRKHNGSAALNWAVIGYKGSPVDFSERFMRLPARVQLKALYLVESNKRKHPVEDIDNAISQDYVPNYDNLKKRMTSSFFFIRKYANRSRYFWNKLEQAASIANSPASVEALKSFTDAKKKNAQEKARKFFIPDEKSTFLGEINTEISSLENEVKDGNLTKSERKEKENKLKKYRDISKNFQKLVKGIDKLAELTELHPNKDDKLSKKEKKDFETSLKDIEKARENLRKEKKFLEGYKHYFFKQTNDLAGYTVNGTSLGTGLYKLMTQETADPKFGGIAAGLTITSTLANLLNDVRTIRNGNGWLEKTYGVTGLASDLGFLGSRINSIAKMCTDDTGKVGDIANYACTAALGICTGVNTVKSVISIAGYDKAKKLHNSFKALQANLQKELDDLEKNKNMTPEQKKLAQQLKNVKKTAAWSTLDKAARLIRRDKRREMNSNFRKWGASMASLVGSIAGYIKVGTFVEAYGKAVSETIFKYTSWTSVIGSPAGSVLSIVSEMIDNAGASKRNREYINAEYPIDDSQRIAAIMNYQKQLQNCTKGSAEYKEIESILSSRDKLDNRIRNLRAGQHVRANQEGLRNEIYESYKTTISKEAMKSQDPVSEGISSNDGEELDTLDKRFVESPQDEKNLDNSSDIHTDAVRKSESENDIHTDAVRKSVSEPDKDLDDEPDNTIVDEKDLNLGKAIHYVKDAQKLMVDYASLLKLNKPASKKSDKTEKKDKTENKDKNLNKGNSSTAKKTKENTGRSLK